MPFLKWFDTQAADDFAKAIASDLAGRVPVTVGGGQKPVTAERLRNAHEAIIARSAAFARDHKLNWYTKASFPRAAGLSGVKKVSVRK